MAPTREQIVQTAEKFVSRGKIEAAIREYKKVLAENPNDNNTLNRVGDLYARIQRIDEAVDFFTQIAQQYADEGFFVKAIAIYKKIIKLNPTHLEVYEKLAELYHKQGLVNEARTQYHVLADYYLKHENPTSAIAIYLKMTELEPDNPTYHVKLAELYQQQKLTEKALNEHRIIAELMIGHGHPQEAVQVYERGLDIDANSLGFIADAVTKLQEAGHHDAAERFLAFAIERNPEAERVSRELGRERESELQRTGSHARPVPPPAPEPEPESQADELEAWGNSTLSEMVAPAPAPEAEEPAEIELDLDEVFVLDMEEDDEPASLVKPPADLAGQEVRRPAWAQAAAESEPAPGAPAAPEEPMDFAAFSPGAAMQAREAEAAGDDRFDLDSGFDLDSLEVELEPAAAPRGRGLEIDPDLLEQTAAELHRPAREREEDLITEAEVLAKYGLEDKALERLQEALQRHPGSLPAYELTIQLSLEKGRHAEIAELATRMLQAVAASPRKEPWQRVRRRLLDSGFRIEAEQVLAPPSAPEATLPELAEEVEIGEIGEIEMELEELVLEELPPPVAAPEPVAPPAEAETALPEIEEWAELPEIEEEEAHPEALEPEPELPTPPAPPPAAPASPPVAPAIPPPIAPTAAHRPARKPAAVDDLLKGLIDVPRTPRAPRPPVPPAAVPPAPAAAASPPPAPAPPPAAPARPAAMTFNPLEIGEMVDSADLDEIPDVSSLPPLAIAIPPSFPGFPEAAPPAGPGPFGAGAVGSGAPSLDDTGGMSWLDEVEAGRNQRGAPRRSARDDDFFDLAGELEEELSREVGIDGSELLLEPAEQSLEQIVEGFKKGVAENLSPTDFETHFNLGIAYREMGLLDEAIGEFQLAAKSADLLVSCCSMLGLCFLDKGLPELAIKWYGRGLEAPRLTEEDHLGLLYDLGNAHDAGGDRDTAYKTFVELYGINSNYRDVVARLEELNPGR